MIALLLAAQLATACSVAHPCGAPGVSVFTVDCETNLFIAKINLDASVGCGYPGVGLPASCLNGLHEHAAMKRGFTTLQKLWLALALAFAIVLIAWSLTHGARAQSYKETDRDRHQVVM